MKRTPLARRTRLSYGATRLERRTPLRARPQRRARPGEPLATWCEAAVADVCQGRAVHRHHVLRRSAGGSDDKTNTLDACAACHSWIHAHPADSYERGFLLRRSA